VSADAAALTDAALDLSYTLCAADPACAQRHGLVSAATTTRTRYLYALPVALAGRPELADAAALINECTAAPPPDEQRAALCEGARYVWLAVLRGAYPCANANEVWQPDTGCACGEGKRCHDECAAVALGDVWSLIVVAALAVLLLAVGALVGFSTLRQQEASIREVERVAADTYAVQVLTTSQASGSPYRA